jgi:hypothetical protein
MSTDSERLDKQAACLQPSIFAIQRSQLNVLVLLRWQLDTCHNIPRRSLFLRRCTYTLAIHFCHPAGCDVAVLRQSQRSALYPATIAGFQGYRVLVDDGGTSVPTLYDGLALHAHKELIIQPHRTRTYATFSSSPPFSYDYKCKFSPSWPSASFPAARLPPTMIFMLEILRAHPIFHYLPC